MDSESLSENSSLQSDSEENDVNGLDNNAGLANALSKVLKAANKKHNKSIVLSKAKLYSDEKKTKKRTPQFEIVRDPNRDIKEEVEEEEDDVKPEVEDIKPEKKDLKSLRIKKKEIVQRGRIKPSVLDRDKERPLMKIATKGVVQLFNAVRQQQVSINKQIGQKGITEAKKEKILKSIDKKAFLDVISRPVKLEKSDASQDDDMEDMDADEKDENAPTWQVLRDDFMMGTKLKDWNRKEQEMEDEEEDE